MFTLSNIDHNPFEEQGLEKVIPTNEPQKEIWAACLLGGEATSLSYNETISVRLNGRLDESGLKQALKQLSARHQAMRAALSPNGETLLIQQEVDLPLQEVDLQGLGLQAAENEWLRQLDAALAIPFNLHQAPLYRLFLHRLAAEVYELTIIAHHLLFDGWSLGVWMEDLSRLYNTRQDPLSIQEIWEPGTLSQYALEQAARRRVPAHQRHAEYWKARLKDIPHMPALPLDQPAPRQRSYQGKRLDFLLPEALYQQLAAYSRKAQTSLTTTCLCALEWTLRERFNWTDFSLGLPVAGQLELDNPNLIGHCVHLLPVPSRSGSAESFGAYLQERKKELLEDLSHKSISFSEILEGFVLPRNKDRIPFVPMIFNMDIGMDQGIHFHHLQHSLSSRARNYTHLDLVLNISGTQDRACCEWTYNTDVFRESSIAALHEQYVQMLERVVCQTGRDTAGKAEPESHAGFLAPDIMLRLGRSCEEFSTHTAISYNDQSLTYQQLKDQLNQLTRQLLALGLQAGDRVAITTQRSPEMLLTMLAILQAGGVFVPLDAQYPPDRKRVIIENIRLRFLVHQGLNDKEFLGDLPDYSITELLALARQQSSDELSLSLPYDRAIYVLHTSGSTGVPKGVCMHQPALANIFDWQVRNSAMRQGHRTLQFSPLNFDVSFQEIFSTLFTGGHLVLIADADRLDASRLLTCLETWNIHRLFLPFVALQSLTEIAEAQQRFPGGLREVITAGEQLKITPQIIRFFQELPDCLLFNHYGPTESHIVTSLTLRGDPLEWPALPSIGREIDQVSMYVLSPDGALLGTGVVGELCISGIALAAGYENLPEQTRERFIAWTHPDGRMLRLYKTGDLGKRLPDGNIQFLGRLDDQIKIRGFRVELSEIEYHLNRLDSVRQSVVLVHHDRQLHNTRLVGYVTLASGKLRSGKAASLLDWKERWEHLYENVESARETENLDQLVVQQLESATDLSAHVREWLDETLSRLNQTIRDRFGERAIRILEVGCGGGQLMDALAPKAEHYYASDYSEAVIRQLRDRHTSRGDISSNCTFSASEANDLSFLGGQQVDLVIINSVVQYFPDETYLMDVIQKSLDHLSPQGCIFLGDVQDRDTLKMCLTREHLPHVKDELSVERFLESVRQRMTTEDELVLDPQFFYKIPYILPDIYHTEIQLKKGTQINETTKYHYDVWLYKDPRILLVDPDRTLSWEAAESTDFLARHLADHPGRILRITDVPNLRLMQDKRLLEQAESAEPGIAVRQLKALAAQTADTGVHPQAMWDLGDKRDFNTIVRPARQATHMDVVFIPKAIEVKTTIPADLFQARPRGSYLEVIDSGHTRELIGLWKQQLREKLPEYMIPERIVCLTGMPVSSTGKIDRKILLQLNIQAGKKETPAQSPEADPRKREDDIYSFLERLWCRILNVNSIQPTDDFFELGGHSLLAIKVMIAIEKAYKIRLPLATLFDHATVGKLAGKIREMQKPKDPQAETELPWNALVPIKRTGNKPPIYLVHGAGLNILIFKLLSKFMDPQQPVYGIQALGQNGINQEFRSVEDIAEKYAEDLMRNDPDGPYLIGGYSYGGFLAYETARVLKRRGKTVKMLAIFDTYVDEFDPRGFNLGVLVRKARFTAGLMLRHPWRYLSYKWKLLRIKLRFWFSGKPHIDRVEAFAYENKIIDQYRKAFKAYKMEAQDIDICLFRAKTTMQYYQEPEYMGWRRFSGNTYVYPVPGEHKTMFYPPYAEKLAEALTRAIRERT